MKKTFDPYTFGNTPAAVNFADILTKQDEKVQQKVAGKIHHYFTLYKQLDQIRSRKARNELARLIYAKAQKVFEEFNVPEMVKTHGINILQTRYKTILKNKYE